MAKDGRYKGSVLENTQEPAHVIDVRAEDDDKTPRFSKVSNLRTFNISLEIMSR